MNIKILEGSGHLPAHLQIIHSLEYAIGFGQLSGGAKLPSVRELAAELGVAPNTVARAYQLLQEDGLLETSHGRGTFVSESLGADRVRDVGASSLREILTPVLKSARAIGFSREKIREMVDELLAEAKITVGFVGIDQLVVDKWSTILEIEFSDLNLEVVGLTLGEVRQGPLDATRRLQSACCVLTLLSTWRDVGDLLRPHGVQILAVLIELSSATHQKLAGLPSLGPVGLICRDFFTNSLVEILTAYVDPDRIRRVGPEDVEGIRRLMSKCDVVVHTFASADLVGLARPGTRLIELEYLPNPAALEQLRVRLEQAAK